MAQGKIVAIDENAPDPSKDEKELIQTGIIHGFVKVTEARVGEHVALGAQLPFFTPNECNLNDNVKFSVETNDKIDKFKGSVSCAIGIAKL